MNDKIPDCEFCNKSSLSLLLLRPSPVALDSRLKPAGSDAVASDMGLVSDLLPARNPTQSRPVLRLLRAGFVHVYAPNPPKPMPNWLVYQVTDNGDLHPHTNPSFNPLRPPEACRAPQHNPMGIRLLTIPQAHLVGTIWVAFSANLWDDKLKARNAANPNVMSQVHLTGASARTFAPTAINLESKVLEFSATSSRDKAYEQDFPFASLIGCAESMAQQMTRAAACHPVTTGKEVALVVADPVGYAAELNVLRLRRQALALDEMAKPENAHPFNSSHLLMGLKQVTIDGIAMESWDKVSPLMHEGQFKTVMLVKPNPRGWPEGTRWEKLAVSHENTARYGQGRGHIVFPDHEERAAAWARDQAAATWSRHQAHYDEGARAAWMQAFNARMDAEHYQPLMKFEEDWWSAATDAATCLRCFELHFDDNDANDPGRLFCPAEVYAREVVLACTPAPLTTGTMLEAYIAELNKPIADKSAILQRALVGNQAELFAKVQAIVDVFDAAQHLHGERNDKLYDLGVGLLKNAEDATNPNGLQRFSAKYRWGLAEMFGAYTFVIKQSWTAAATYYASRLTATASGGGRGGALLARLQGLQFVQHATELVQQATLSRGLFRTPVQITKLYPVGEAMVVLGARGGFSRADVVQAKRGGMVAVTILSDNVELARYAGKLDELVMQQGGKVTLANKTATLLTPALTVGAMVLSEEQFDRLRKAKVPATALAAAAMKEAMHARLGVIKSVDGRLALGAILINGVQLNKALGELSSQDLKKVRDAWVGTLDSSASVVAAMMQVLEVGAKESITRRLGAQAANSSMVIHALRPWAAGLGAFAAAVSAVGQLARGSDAMDEGQTAKGVMLYGSGTAFGGLFAIGSLATLGAIADKQVGKGLAGVFMRRMAARYGAQGAATLLGVSMSGWGLILLGGALIFEAGAVMLTPTQLQEWMRRSYFGKWPADKQFKKGNWDAEVQALQKLLEGFVDTRHQDIPPAVPQKVA
jgi:hypothetical protein